MSAQQLPDESILENYQGLAVVELVESADHMVRLPIWKQRDGRYAFRSFKRNHDGSRNLIRRHPKKLDQFAAIATLEVRNEWARLGLGTAEQCVVTPLFIPLKKARVKASSLPRPMSPPNDDFFDPTKEYRALPFSRGHFAVYAVDGLNRMAKLIWGVLVAWASMRIRRVEAHGRFGVRIGGQGEQWAIELAAILHESPRSVEDGMQKLMNAGLIWWKAAQGSWSGIVIHFRRHPVFRGSTSAVGAEVDRGSYAETDGTSAESSASTAERSTREESGDRRSEDSEGIEFRKAGRGAF